MHRGTQLLDTPILNKGTAFSEEERNRLGLHGLLPFQVETLDKQAHRAYAAYQKKDDDLERHIYLRALQDTNEVLFYRLLLDHIEEMLPMVYTPVVALACQQFSRIYRRPRGIFISYPYRHSIQQILKNRPHRQIDVVVVTDGERILGIGDQGVGGIAIPIGKLSLYTLIGGIYPERTLPIFLDAGTNNQECLNDPEYLGWRHERIVGQDYDDFIEQFVQAVSEELPGTCLQWEDFSVAHARPILQRYQNQLLTFNDDIQGTASVVLGAILGAIRLTGISLKEQQIVILGAGSTAIGVADYLRMEMVEQGLSEEEACRQFWIVNKGGLIHQGRSDLTQYQKMYAQPSDRVADWPRTVNGSIGLQDVIGKVNATILLGFSTTAGAFSESIVRTMSKKVKRPIIFPLSNPTTKAEAKAEDLIRWTNGRGLITTGSPSLPVTFKGRTYSIGQCNNVYIFPALGLGLVASGAKRITDGMFLAAARTLAENSPASDDPTFSLLPKITDLRQLAIEIAVAVGVEAQKLDLAPTTTEKELRQRVVANQWVPVYS